MDISSRDSERRDALDTLQAVVDDLFYAASCLRRAGDTDAATRLGNLGDKANEELILLRKGPVLS